MKKLVFLATTLLMFLAITVNAQQRGPRERMTPEQQCDPDGRTPDHRIKVDRQTTGRPEKMVYRIVQKA